MIDKRYLFEVRLNRTSVSDFNIYPFSIPAIQNLHTLEIHKSLTFFVGENGMGKSTLLEAIAVKLGFNAEGGSRNFRFSTRASHSELYKNLITSKGAKKPKDGYFFRAESFYNLASNIEALDEGFPTLPKIIDNYGGKGLHNQSHGESFFSLFTNRLGGCGLYLFDEPESALSPSRQIAFLSIIHQLILDNSQLIISTHSPILLAYPNSIIYEIRPDGIKRTPYTKTDCFNTSHHFINNYSQVLKELLKVEPASNSP